jgi:hypothetical protein
MWVGRIAGWRLASLDTGRPTDKIAAVVEEFPE